MEYISRQDFIREFSLMKHTKHLKTKDVANNCDLTPQYLYYLSSPKSTASRKVKISVVQEIAKGLKLNDSQTKSWISTMISTPNNQYVHTPKTVQNHDEVNHVPSNNPNHPVVSVKYIHVSKQLQSMIRHAMAERELSVHRLAHRSHLNHNYIYSLINGKVPYISKVAMIKVAKGLGMNVNVMAKPDEFSKINGNYLNKKPTHINNSHHNQAINYLRPSVLRAARDMSKLSDTDVNIIDLLINRLADSNK